jgi:hypothetical protein
MATSADSSPGSRDTSRAEGYVGVALYGSVVTGLAGLGVALFGMFSGQLQAAALGVLAAAIAFGALINALLRH